MAVTDVISTFRTTVSDFVYRVTRSRKTHEWKDVSREHRKIMASKIAIKEFEQAKERALMESYKAGFFR